MAVVAVALAHLAQMAVMVRQAAEEDLLLVLQQAVLQYMDHKAITVGMVNHKLVVGAVVGQGLLEATRKQEQVVLLVMAALVCLLQLLELLQCMVEEVVERSIVQ
jgi:hypothetical protein